LARKSYLPNPGDVYWVDTVILPDYELEQKEQGGSR